MKVIKGSDRIAYIGERHTVKIAKSNPQQFLKSARYTKERSGIRGVVSTWQALTADQHQSLKNFLFHGVVANRREEHLAKQHKGIVVPTVSILGGLVNVQPTVPSTGLSHAAIHSAFATHLDPRVTRLGHMLEDTSNMGVIDGSVMFTDGGSIGLESFMEKQPQAVRQALGALTLQINAMP
jgi:hypothetical protein